VRGSECVYVCAFVCELSLPLPTALTYEVATVSRIDKTIGLF